MKISIFSFAVNNKFPIDIQYRQFKKYLKEDFEFILFNDAFEDQAEKDINTITSYNNISCVRVPQRIHGVQNPSESYAETLNWAVRDYAVNNNCEVIVLIHTDVFPIQETSILDIIKDYIVASVTEYRILNGKGIIHFYPAFTIINMNLLKEPNTLDFGLAPGLDTGGKTHYFISNNSDKVKFIDNPQTSNLLKELPEFFKLNLQLCQQYGLSAGWVADGFYHYIAGSMWNATDQIFAEGHKKRMALFLAHFY